MDTHNLQKFNNTKDLAQWYNEKYQSMGGGWECPESVALEYLAFMGITSEETPRAKLLDVGCGEGHFMKTAQKFCDCWGIDISQYIIELASKRVPEAKFMVDDIESSPFFERFEYAASIGSIEHCIDIKRAINAIWSALLYHGKFYLLVPNEEWQHFDQPNETTHTDEEWKALFSTEDWYLVEQKRTGNISHFLYEKVPWYET